MKTLEERFWEKVGTSGDCWIWTACKNIGGYGTFKVNGRMRVAHRISYEMAGGMVPAGMILDHKCHNRACVRPEHVHPVTYKQNSENRAAPNANSKSGIRGVSWHTASGKWRAKVKHHGECQYLGMFDDIEKAAQAVIAARNDLYTNNRSDWNLMGEK